MKKNLLFIVGCLFALLSINPKAVAQCGPGQSKLTLSIDFSVDAYPDEDGWRLVNTTTGLTVDSACFGAYSTSTGVETIDICVDTGATYVVYAYDDFGDGLDGSIWSIAYTYGGMISTFGGINANIPQTLCNPAYTNNELADSSSHFYAMYVAPPACLTPTVNSGSNSLSATTAGISWVENGTATSWRVEWDTAGYAAGTARNTVVVMNNAFTTLTGLMAETDYDWNVRALCSASDSSSLSGASFTTPCVAFAAPFIEDFTTFIPVCWNEANNGTIATGPTSLGSGNWTLTNGAAEINLYTTGTEDWIISPTIDFGAGGYELAIDARVYAYNSPSTPSAMGSDDTVHIAISTDNGMTWTSLYSWNAGNTPTNTFTKYTVDLTAYTGSTNIIGIYASEGAVNDPEDFDIELDNFELRIPPSCPAPSMLSTSGLTATDATLSWLENGTATQWEIEYGTASFTQGTGATVIVNTDTFTTITGLTAQTSYSWYVRAICGVADTSQWVGPNNFTTPCVAFTAPYSEAFNGGLPACWAQGAGNGESWVFSTTGGHVGNAGNQGAGTTFSGGGLAYVDDSTPDNVGTTLESPLIDISGLTVPRLTFYTISNNEGQSNVDFHVDVYDGANWNDSLYFSDANSANNTWEKIIVDLSTLTITGDIQIRFVVDEVNPAGQFYDDRAIDDVVVEETPNCIATNSNPVASITATSALISWIENGTASQWEVEYGLAGFAIGSGTSVIVNTDTFTTLTSLMSASDYDYYVRAICSPTDTSNRSTGSFTTLCPPAIAAPYMENFDGLALTSPYTAMPNCWAPQTGPDFWDVTNDVVNTGHSFLPNIGDHTTGSSNYMWIDASSNITANEMVTPDIDISGLTAPFVGFWFASNNTTNNINHTIALDAWDGAAWVNITSLSGNFGTWVEVSGAVPGTIPSTTRFRIYATANPAGTSANYFYNDLGVDDFFVGEAPSCPATTNHLTFNTTAFDTDVAWTENGPATSWEVEWDLAGYTVGSATNSMIVSNDTFAITGLSPVTNYEWSVRAVCGPADSSTWSPKSSFLTPVTCPAPSALSTVAISSTDIDLSWTNNSSATSFEIEYGLGAFTQGTGTLVITSTNPHSLTGLMPNTAYSWFVRAICGPADTSLWTARNSFTTPCAAFTAPWFDDVETHSPIASAFSISQCWQGSRNNTANYWGVDGSGSTPSTGTGPLGANSGTNYFYFEASSGATGDEAYLLSPLVDISSLPNAELSFYYHMFGAGNNVMADLFVEVFDGTNFVLVDSIKGEQQANQADPFLQRKIDISSFSGTVQVRFTAVWNGFQWGDISLDDIGINDACASITAPYVESFNAPSTNTPKCWSQSTTTGGPWVFNVAALPDFGNNVAMPDHTSGVTGSYAWVDMSGTDVGVILTTPEIDVTALTTPALSFWVVSHNNTGSVSVFNKIYVEANNGTNFVLVDSIQGDFGLQWKNFLYDVSANTYNSNIVQFRFRAESGGSASDFDNDMLLDDVEVYEFPTCLFSDTLLVSGVTTDSAIVTWNNPSNASSFEISYGLSGFTPGMGIQKIVSNNIDTLTSLMSSSTYDVYVRSICSVGDTSRWSVVASFSTDCAPFATPFSESFNTTNLPTCWAQSAIQGGPWVFGTPGFTWNTQGCTAVPVDHTGNGGNFAAMDFSVPDAGVVLELPEVDVASLSAPYFQFYYTQCDNLNPANILVVEAYNGTTWDTVRVIQEGTNGWKRYGFLIGTYTYNTSIVKLRFRAEDGGGTQFYGDMGIDDVTIDQAPADDIAVDAIVGPNSGCGLSATEVVSIEISNQGSATQTSFSVGYSLNGVAITPETFTGSIASGATAVYNFTTTADLSMVGNYNIVAYVDLTNDIDSINDTTEAVVISSANVNTFPYAESFETGNGDWLVTGVSTWALGTPAGAIIDTASDGTQAWVTNLTGNYADNSLGFVNSPCFDFSTISNPWINLDIWYDIETSWDGALLQTSTDGGMSWQTVGALGDFLNWYNDGTVDALNPVDPAEDGWSGTGTSGSGGWITASHGLSGLGGQATVNLRIAFASDGNTNNEGMAFDNIHIYDRDPSYAIEVLNTEDASGVADSIGVTAWTSGIVVGIDLDGNNGISFTIIEDSSGVQEGMNIFNFNDVSNYVVNEGDEIMVHGSILQFRGLTELSPDSIILLSTGNAIPTPLVVTDLDESTESRYLSIPTSYWSLGSVTGTGGSFNLDLTNGTDTITMRVDSDTDIRDSLAASPAGGINVGDTICGLLGVGGQFSSTTTAPFLDGYQIFPMRWSDLTICTLATGIDNVETETAQFNLVPNPTNGVFEIRTTGFNNPTVNVIIRDISGRIVSNEFINNANNSFSKSFDLDGESKGVYFITITDGNDVINEKLIVQ